MNLALETWSLGKRFQEKKALDKVNLRVPRGSIFALLGPAAAGKSTLLKLILGLQHPSAGGGLCLGFDILTRGLQIREKAGYLGQEPCFYGYMTAAGLLHFCRGFYRHWENSLAGSLLDRLKIPERVPINRFTREQRRCLGLVVALAPRPDLLLLDEPTAGFDPVERRLFFSIIQEEVAARKMTVLIASRYFGQVEGIATEAAFIHGGQLGRSCSVEHLRSKEKEFRAVFQKEPLSS